MIRRAKAEDLEILERLIKTASRSAGVLTRPKDEIKKVINNFYVLEIEKEIVACCSLEIYNQKIAEIRSVVVALAFQNKGLGKKLIKRCIIEAEKLGISEILAVTDKDDFFGKLGFQKSVDNKWPMFMKLK